MADAIACIVEGHGEMEAVPLLIRRIARVIDPTRVIRIPMPIRVPRQKIVKPGEVERATELAARKVGSQGAVLILLDAETDCPAELGPALLGRARQARNDLPIGVVLAKCEYEAWFLESAVSLRGLRGLATNLAPPPDPESIQGAKQWLTRHMEETQHYVETLHQPAFTACFDLATAQRAASFEKCYREIARLLDI